MMLMAPPAVDRDLIRLFEKGAEGARETFGGGMAEHGDGNRAARQHHEGGDLRAFDDVAVFARIVEPSLCRLFCALRIVAVFGHRISSGNAPSGRRSN